MEKKLFEKFIVPFFIFGLFVLGVSLVPVKETKNAALEISFLDVGQGDSALIKTTEGKYILVDGGPDKKVLTRLGEIMSPTKKELEAVILTHPHADHVAGLNYVLDSYKVNKIYLTGADHNAPEYTTFLDKIKNQHIPAEKFYFGKEFEINEIKFNGLSPAKDVVGDVFKDLNASSIAFKLSYYKNTFLFLGDLPNEQQAEIMSKYPLGYMEVIKIAHHGSKNGTSKELIDVTQPKHAVISSGVKNDFGHPAPSVLSLLSGVNVLRTDRRGTIRFFVTKDSVSLN